METLKFYKSVLQRAWSLYWARLVAWSDSVILFLVQAAVLAALLYFAPVMGDLQDQGRQMLAGTTAVVLAAAFYFVYDLIRAPALLDAEKSRTIAEQGASIEAAVERQKPRIAIERLALRPNDVVWCLEVRNPSPTEPLSQCFARIEHVKDATGKEIYGHLTLVADTQEGRRFNLDPEQMKRIPLCAAHSGGGAYSFRLMHEGGTPKLVSGDYTILIHVTSNKGGSPAKATVTMKGSKVALASTG